ncbi:hypothetical protein [Cupriavidus necator]|uniref:hypothetical protein n=1 Tax=Cupriavidus necator TaxID=106590 RepID=UPI001E582115|nr:hypothetical protein [Cupriavidus necator]
MRPARVPRDARPVYDEDMDCIIGYHRSFASGASTYDLAGDVVALSECADEDSGAPASLLVAGALWRPRVRGITRSGAEGEGLAAPATTLTRLRGRFITLARAAAAFHAVGAGGNAGAGALCAAAYPAPGNPLARGSPPAAWPRPMPPALSRRSRGAVRRPCWS